MRQDIVQQFENQRVPRYTSYPTSPHFTEAVDDAQYQGLLAAVPECATLSLYLHVPFCQTLCWYCGCHTKIVRHYDPIAAYVKALEREIELAADALPARMKVGHVHWGGGTPTILTAEHLRRVTDRLRERFAFAADAEVAVEIDPRRVSEATIEALAACGVTRASLGVQSFDPVVQQAINRIQSFEQTASVTEALRKAGVKGINFDLIYGLPHQTIASCEDTVAQALRLSPDRLAVFGYAHLPSLKKHQQMIDEAALPDGAARIAQFEAIADRLAAGGYRRIGLDHFAKPADDLSRCLDTGMLRRNFQGYTSDQSDVLIGFGASAVGGLPQGYVQNVTQIGEYQRRLAAGRLAATRGRRLTADDRLRREVIERIMCDFRVDLGAILARYGGAETRFRGEVDRLRAFERQGLLHLDGLTVELAEDCWPFARSVAAVFDSYLQPDGQRHAKAV